MSNNFFKPYIGDSYIKGIKGMKILVLGASFYCPKTHCLYFQKCTSTSVKDSSSYDEICPEYSSNGICLHDEPSNSIENRYPTYQTFTKGMASFIGDDDYDAIWRHLAFTNYVQFFLPSNGENFRMTNANDLSERDFKAFIDVVKELAPDIVVVWGCVINSHVKEQNPTVYDKAMLKQNEDYLCHMIVPGIDHNITIVNPNHPSSPFWHSDKKTIFDILRESSQRITRYNYEIR